VILQTLLLRSRDPNCFKFSYRRGVVSVDANAGDGVPGNDLAPNRRGLAKHRAEIVDGLRIVLDTFILLIELEIARANAI